MTEKSIAVIGAGWAGLTCALELSAAGKKVTLFESNAIPGGRARRIVMPDGSERDNGQHLLLGAYVQTLAQIAKVNSDAQIDKLLQRFPLTLVQRPRTGAAAHFAMRMPSIPGWHGLGMLLRATGLTFAEKAALVRYFLAVFFRIGDNPVATVAQDIEGLGVTLRDRLIAPLCLAALNTPIERASAQVFRNVLRASFTASAKTADMLIPRVDLSALFPDPAVAKLRADGATVHLKETVFHVRPGEENGIEVVTRNRAETFTDCVLAVPPYAVSRLLDSFPGCEGLAKALSDLHYEPITTVWQTAPPAAEANTPIYHVNDAELQWFVYHPKGKFRTIVVSGTEANEIGDLEERKARVAHKLSTVPSALVAVTERRATYACTPQQSVRLSTLPLPRPPLWLAGDYRYPQFPGTIEAAVRSGLETANAIISFDN
jgi:hydroxysqualene dehydroxylase